MIAKFISWLRSLYSFRKFKSEPLSDTTIMSAGLFTDVDEPDADLF